MNDYQTATLAQLRRAAKAAGATIDITRHNGGIVNVDAPQGQVFTATFTHHVSHGWEAGFPCGEAYAMALADIAEGFQACDDKQCEVCEGE